MVFHFGGKLQAAAHHIVLRLAEVFGPRATRRRLRWERAWRAVRYDWNGLAQIKLENVSGARNLQEYWRMPATGGAPRDPATMMGTELFEDQNGKVWHIVHLPLEAQPKGIERKQDWTEEDPLWRRVEGLVRERLDAAQETEPGANGTPASDERRAVLDGAILRGLPRRTDKNAEHVRYRRAFFRDFVQAHQCSFGSCADFSGALFAAGAQFYRATFAGGGEFEEATFLGNAEFSGARFKCRADFEGAEFFELVSFSLPPAERGLPSRPTVFQDAAKFSKARFRQGGDFHLTRFAGKASFNRARFDGDARFEATEFKDAAVFSNSRLRKRSQFRKAHFEKSALFDHARFGGGPPGGPVNA